MPSDRKKLGVLNVPRTQAPFTSAVGIVASAVGTHAYLESQRPAYSAKRRQDLKPSTSMIRNCSSFLQVQLRIVDPKVIVLLGSMSLKAYVQWETGKASAAPQAEWVGRVDEWHGRRVIPLANTSGLSTWLNDPENKALQIQAKRLLTAEVDAIRRSAGI